METLFADHRLGPPWTLCPSTTDAAIADEWLHEWTDVPGLEGVVAKSLRSLVAVTAKSNWSKSDKDPAQWLPPAASAQCTYASDWVATKLQTCTNGNTTAIGGAATALIVAGGGITVAVRRRKSRRAA